MPFGVRWTGTLVVVRRVCSGAFRERGSCSGSGDEVGVEHRVAAYLGRCIAEAAVIALRRALVVRHSPPTVAEAFLASRVAGDRGLAFGTLPSGVDVEAIVERHRPTLRSG